MRKIFTLVFVLAFALGISAQDDVRKVWDFRQGFSEETLSNLAADAASGTGQWTDASSKGYYEMKARSAAGEITCKVNGEDWVIPELQGLKMGSVSNQHFNLVFQSEKLGPHFWLNGKKSEDCVTIPKVPAGETITVIYSSHKDTEARGFKVSTTNVVGKEDGKTTFTTMGKDTVVLINNNTETKDVKLSATNGMHFHLICVGPVPEEAPSNKQIAYLYDSTFPEYNVEGDVVAAGVLEGLLKDTRAYAADIKYIDIAGDVSALTKDSLETFDCVIVSDAISSTNAFVSNIKDIIAYTPVLKLTPSLYDVWGYGAVATTGTNVIDIPAAELGNKLFAPYSSELLPYIDENNQISMLETGELEGYTANADSYFANDDVLATAAGVNAIHVHNANRNAYMMIPVGHASAFTDASAGVASNAIVELIKTKRDVVGAAKPVATQDFHDKYTTVSLKCNTANSKIYYTTNGTEPTSESTLYTTPFDINTTGVIVKAMATADGYLPGEVSDNAIDIYELTVAPTISTANEDGKTTVTIIPANADDKLYFNFTASEDTLMSQVYTEPIVLTKHATITAFAGQRDLFLASEPVSKVITVNNETVRMDVVAHFDANKADWSPTGSNPDYYVGKNGYSFYTDEVIDTKSSTNEFGDEIFENVYAERDSLTTLNPGNGWEFKTYGQAGLWQSNSLTHNVGDGAGYNPESAYDESDFEGSNYCVSFGGVGTDGNGKSDPRTASIQSTVAFQAPFDVVSYIATTKDGQAIATLYVSNDTTSESNWVEVGKLVSGSIKRLWKKTILPYEGTDKVFIKVMGENSTSVFDLFVKNFGEKSQAYVDGLTGIEDVNMGEGNGEITKTLIYGVDGTQSNKLVKGINIVKRVYTNGDVKVTKVLIK